MHIERDRVRGVRRHPEPWPARALEGAGSFPTFPAICKILEEEFK